jgi:hypothetical protein
MLRVLRSKTLSINSVADLNENSCGKLPTFFSIYLLTFKTVSTVTSKFWGRGNAPVLALLR